MASRYTDSLVLLRRVFQVSLAFTALAVIAALFIPDVSAAMTSNVAVHLKNDKPKDEKEAKVV
jgi:hypothetical protein